MGYCASADGGITLFPGVNIRDVKELLDMSCFESDISVDSTDSYETDICIWMCFDKYYEDTVYNFLNEIKRYAKSITVNFTGEDGEMWTIYLEDGELKEDSLTPIQAGEYRLLLNCKYALINMVKRMEKTQPCEDVAQELKNAGLLDKDMQALGLSYLVDLLHNETESGEEPRADEEDEDGEQIQFSLEDFNALIGGGFLI